MLLRDALLADIDHECAVTRRLMTRMPGPSLGWRPHEKSFSLAGLGTHLGQLPHWGTQILERPGYDLESATGHAVGLESLTDILDTFDRHVAEVRNAVTDRTDGELTTMWSLTRGGETLLVMPRAGALRTFFLHHLIHHRGQLTVYLRLLGVPLPAVYGPTADEPL